jgi:hypothetical protein
VRVLALLLVRLLVPQVLVLLVLVLLLAVPWLGRCRRARPMRRPRSRPRESF